MSDRVMQKQKDFLRYRLNIGAGIDNRIGEYLTAMSFLSSGEKKILNELVIDFY